MFWDYGRIDGKECVFNISTSKLIMNVTTNGGDFDLFGWSRCSDDSNTMLSVNDGRSNSTVNSCPSDDIIIVDDDDDELQNENCGKRKPYCKRCRLHGRKALSRDHKRYCPFQLCACVKCLKLLADQKLMAQKVADRRALDQDRRTGLKPMYYDLKSRQFIFSTRANDSVHETAENASQNESHGKRKPNCKRCRLHDTTSSLRDHKRYCPFQFCKCVKCRNLLAEQKKMANKVAVRRGLEQDRRTGLKPMYDDSIFLGFVKKNRKLAIPQSDGKYTIVKPSLFLSPVTLDTTHGSVNATEHHRRLQALKQMLDSFHSQGVDGTLICSYIILKECDFVVDKAFEKILDARNDIGSYTGRDPSNLVAPSSNNYWSTVVPQGAASQSTALLYPQLNCLPPYYGYPFPSSAAAAASGNAAATAAAAAAWQAAAGASGSGHPLMKAEPISLCSYPPVVQHPSSAGALNSVSSSLGGPGQPPPMMEITTSGDSRGSDCRGDDSDREGVVPGQERSVSVDRGMGSNDDVQSDRTPPGPGTEDAATSPNSALVLRSSFQPTSLSFAALHSYKNRTQSIES